MAYTTKTNGSVVEVHRNDVHIATYDPITEETSYTKPENEKYSNHVGRVVNDIKEGALKLTDPAAETPPPDANATPTGNTAAPADIDFAKAALANAGGGVSKPDFSAKVETVKVMQPDGNAKIEKLPAAKEEDKDATIRSLRSQLQETLVENARLRDALASKEGKVPGTTNRIPERYADEFDTTGAPAQDPRLGDLTPAFVEWAREKMPKEIFEKRYKNRLPKTGI